MYSITKQFRFAAAHSLPSLPGSHKCHTTHGHNYTIELHLQNTSLDRHGFVVDYGELATFKQWVSDELDHTDLSEPFHPRTRDPHVCAKMEQASAELLARTIYDVLLTDTESFPWAHMLTAVTVRETENTSATFKSF